MFKLEGTTVAGNLYPSLQKFERALRQAERTIKVGTTYL